MTSRRFYVDTAAVLADRYSMLLRTAWLDDRQATEIHRMYTIALAGLFAQDNARFDSDKFFRAADAADLADN